MSTIGLPVIDVTFKKQALTIAERSSKGVVAVIVKEDLAPTNTVVTYVDVAALKKDQALYAVEAYNAIADVFLGNVKKVHVVKISKAKTAEEALPLLENLQVNWVTMIAGESTDYSALVAWEKSENLTRNKPVKVVAYKVANADSAHTVNFTNTSVKRKTDAAPITGDLYLGRIVGLLAGLPFTMSATYSILHDLESVSDVADVSAAIGKGEFILINDEACVLVARGVTSLQTIGDALTEDYKHIAFVEAIDLIKEDIKRTFKYEFVGKFKNTASNQAIFLSAVNGYYKALSKIGVLSEDFENVAMIDVPKMRAVWSTMGKDLSDLSNGQVAKQTIDKDIYVSSSIKVANAIEALYFETNLQ